MTIPSKIAGGLSLASCIVDIHKTAVINANNAYAKASSDTFVSCAVGTQKTNRLSYKDAERKNWLLKNNFFGGINETLARIGGYFKGLGRGVIRYLPNFILAGLAMIPKNKTIANISAIGLGALEAFDFVKNATSITQRTDYLK